jgi:hypothetical protein
MADDAAAPRRPDGSAPSGVAERRRYERDRAALLGPRCARRAPVPAPAPAPSPAPAPAPAPALHPADDWAVLGVPRDASVDAVRRTFKALATLWHPDKTRDAAAHEHFIRLKAAHDRLVARLA